MGKSLCLSMFICMFLGIHMALLEENVEVGEWEYDFTELEEWLSETCGMEYGTFNQWIELLLQGRVEEVVEDFPKLMYNTFLQELEASRGTLMKLFTIGISLSILGNLCYGQPRRGDVGFYVIDLLAVALLVSAFRLMYQMTVETIGQLVSAMEALLPVYTLAVGISQGPASTALLTEGVALGNTFISRGIYQIFLPGTLIYVGLVMINSLNREDYLSRFGELVRTGIVYGLKSILGVLVGINGIKSMLTPQGDVLAMQAFKKGLTLIPGGQMVGSVSGMMISSTLLIKNAIGIGGIFMVIMGVALPLMKLCIFVFAYRGLAAVLQPLVDKRMIQGIQGISDGGELLIRILLTVTAMFLVTIALVAVNTGAAWGR